jgi:diguanylate cyclase (GGDEF)-like protein
MREFLGVDVLANAVSMLASSRRGAIWISDCDEEARFYESRCAHPEATVLPAPNQATDVLTSVKHRGIDGVLATIPNPEKPLQEDEFSLSAGDVISLLVLSPSCMRILEEVGGRNWLAAADVVTGGFMNRSEQIAVFYGVIARAIAAGRMNRGAGTELLQGIVSWPLFEINRSANDNGRFPEELWRRALAKAEEYRELKGRSNSAPFLGDDLLIVLGNALTHFRPRGVTPNRTAGPDELLPLLFAGYDIHEFESDELYWDLRTWQRIKKYPVLREWRLLEPFGLLLDQRYWERDLAKFLSYGDRRVIAVLKLDLDNFKAVNERLGHAGGDEALKLYSSIIKEEIGAIAEIYRRGGDEVIAFAPFITPEEARDRAESLRAAIEGRFRRWGRSIGLEVSPTASVGLVLCLSTDPQEDVVKAIDAAQKRAKDEGKNRVVEIAISLRTAATLESRNDEKQPVVFESEPVNPRPSPPK